MGPSGSGKSTLLNILSALDVPTTGTVSLAGLDIASLPDDEVTRFRRDKIGLIFQFFNLLPTMTAVENVLLPVLLARRATAQDEARAVTLLERVGLGHRLQHRPGELSGGEMQRVAIARAFVTSPSILLADEPTGNLDSASGAEVLRLLRQEADERGTTVVMVTHDAQAARVGTRLVVIRDGRVHDDSLSAGAEFYEANGEATAMSGATLPDTDGRPDPRSPSDHLSNPASQLEAMA